MAHPRLWVVVALLVCVASEEWDNKYRKSGWVPSPTEGHWEGQNKTCSARYGRALGSYGTSYKGEGCVLNVATVAEQYSVVPRKTVDSNFKIEAEPTLAGCARTCYAGNKLLPGFNETSVGEAPPAAATLGGASRTPLSFIHVVWDHASSLCYCFDDAPLDKISCATDDCMVSCGSTWLSLPLGCLFTDPTKCTRAPRDSCLYGNGCCYDTGLPEEWDNKYRKSGWVPSPTQGRWDGQNEKCTAKYGRALGSYETSYKREACVLNVATVAEQYSVVPRKTVDSNYKILEEPTLAGCARTCFAGNKLLPGFNETSVGEAPPAAATLGGASSAPLSFIHVVWDPASSLCYCFNDAPLDKIACATDDCKRSCKTTWLSLPLGCLFTDPSGCTDAPYDSCLYEKGCCSDSLGVKWPYRIAPPLWWVFSGFSFLLISIVIMMYRQVPRSRARPSDPNTLESELIEKHKFKYEALLEKLLIDLNPEDTISQCSVCLNDLTEARCAQFECGHRLHYTCMKEYIMYQIGKVQRRYPECPVCRRRILLDDDSDGEDGEHQRTGVSVVVVPVEQNSSSPEVPRHPPTPTGSADGEELQLIQPGERSNTEAEGEADTSTGEEEEECEKPPQQLEEDIEEEEQEADIELIENAHDVPLVE